jgi:Tol biopolymer transport system component
VDWWRRADPALQAQAAAVRQRIQRLAAAELAWHSGGDDEPRERAVTDSTERLSAALVGRYRVLRRLGEGGMALVYLAEDLKHGRQVALKVLRPELAQALGPERFLREIAIAARLTHPNILPLLDSGEAEGTLFYVMPYVAGESLRDRLVREGQLPVDEAVRLVQRVALALGYAHGLGVIHRDIKPENILLSGGEPVVTDFGIAKAVSAAGQTKLTETGFAVGTAAYMSPEQASAEAQLDGRSDLYGLGVVLYELLAGAPPFTGPTVHAITARKLTEPVPPLRTVRETVPVAVEQVVFKALAKLPADRFASAQQLAEALEPAVATAATRPAAGAAFGLDRRGRALPWAIALLAVVVAGVFSWRDRAPREPVLRLSVDTPRETAVYGLGSPVALSPDGRTLVFVAGRNDTTRLYVRRLDDFAARPLAGSEGGDSPFFSPDGRWVGFFSRRDNQLRRVALGGGTATTIAQDLNPYASNAIWAPNDTVYFTNWPDRQVSKVAATGGAVSALTTGDPPEGWFRFPLDIVPGGRELLVLVMGGVTNTFHVDAVSLRTGTHRRLLDGASDARVMDGRWLLWVPVGSAELRAQAFDVRDLRVTGDPVRILDSVATLPGGQSFLALGPEGTLAYVPLVQWQDPDVQPDLAFVGRDGRAEPARLPHGGGPRFSPDGRRLVYIAKGRHDPDIAVYDLASGVERHLTGEGAEMWPIFSHDGRRVVFNWAGGDRTGKLLLAALPADGSGRITRLPTDTLNHQQPFTWTPDGAQLLYTEGPGAAGEFHIWITPLPGGPPRRLLTSKATDTQPALSPDGRWLAYMTDASGTPQVVVRRFPDGTDVPVSREAGGAVEPAWSPDGRELYFRDVRGTRMMVAAFSAGAAPSVGTPRVLFAGRYATCYIWCRNYDVSPDGRRFVMMKDPGGWTAGGYWPSGTEIRIAPHFDREVEERMRAARR